MGLAPPAPAPGVGRVAFLFPGQGSQRTGMLGELLVALPELRHYLHLGRAHADRLFPPAAFDDTARERHRAALTDTRTAQPALGIAGLAAHAFLTSAGVRPRPRRRAQLRRAGRPHAAAGALDPETLLELSAERAAAILAAAGDGARHHGRRGRLRRHRRPRAAHGRGTRFGRRRQPQLA
ncbi:hypothetical protein LT493_27165 [Streptomyces tricolor]|nr:hypothetical protein [Streptomyces tricolor]